MSRAPRRLFLHVSALTDVEYDVYTTALHDILDCADNSECPSVEDYEDMVLGVREVRAWMKGRYRDVGDLDKILRLFSPGLGHNDTLTGGQFLAALRLIMHVRNGAEVTEGMIFVQAVPVSPTTKYHQTPFEAPTLPIQPHERTIQPEDTSVGRSGQTTSDTSTNPFVRSSVSDQASLQDGSHSRAEIDGPPKQSINHILPTSSNNAAVSPPMKVHSLSQADHSNPFLQRSKSHTGVAVESTYLAANTKVKSIGRIPPLPPRKPASLHPDNASISLSRSASTSASHHPQLAGTSKPPPPHPLSTSPLMRQSLQASKAGLSLKKAQAQLEKERVLEVIRSSSSSSVRGVQRSQSPSKSDSSSAPRRFPSPTRSVTSSANSLEQVASASLPTSPPRTYSPDGVLASSPPSHPSPTRRATDLPSAPPTHPDRRSTPLYHSGALKTSQSSSDGPSSSPLDPPSPTAARATRSKSLHYPSTASPPLPPPPRRRRPESVQLTPTRDSEEVGSPFTNAFAPSASPAPSSSSFVGLTRHLSHTPHSRSQSLAHSLTHSDTQEPADTLSMSGLQKALTQLQTKAQPTLNRARYKAEAGLAPRRGFVQHYAGAGALRDEGEEMLVRPGVDDGEVDSEGEQDWTDNERLARNNGDRGRHAGVGVDRDEMKWPAGDGWTPL